MNAKNQPRKSFFIADLLEMNDERKDLVRKRSYETESDEEDTQVVKHHKTSHTLKALSQQDTVNSLSTKPDLCSESEPIHADHEEKLSPTSTYPGYFEHGSDETAENDYVDLNNDSFEQSGDVSRSSRSRSPSKSRSRSRSNSSSSSCNLKKNRKSRTAFSDHQLDSLEKSFEKHKYLSVQDRIELAVRLNLTDTQVKTWYQNRRTKWKRQSSIGIEWLMAAAAAEQSSVLQYSNNCINPAKSQANYNDTQSQATNSYNSYSNLFQTSHLYPQQSNLGSRPLQGVNKEEVSGTPSINSWFMSALSQYSMANKAHAALSDQSSSEQNSYCY